MADSKFDAAFRHDLQLARRTRSPLERPHRGGGRQPTSAWAGLQRRSEWIAVRGMPYRKTYQFQAGQNWTHAPETQKQTETYVAAGPDTYEPVGAVVARELTDAGALVAGFIEMWGGIVFVDQKLVCRPIELSLIHI